MAVILRDIPFPKYCGECFAFDREYEYCQLYSYGVPARCDIYDTSIRPDWCELEEVKE